MKISNAKRKENIVKNLDYLMTSRKESKSSFSTRTGIHRTTIYNILEGMVNNIQQSTVYRISNFFGVSRDEIQYHNIEEIENKRRIISPEGNKNPAAVPIIPESEFVSCLDKPIGQLSISYPLTYFLDEASDLVAIRVETFSLIPFSVNDMLIIKRASVAPPNYLMVVMTEEKNIILERNKLGSENRKDRKIVGYIIEERV